jgi:hypothetical protein
MTTIQLAVHPQDLKRFLEILLIFYGSFLLPKTVHLILLSDIWTFSAQAIGIAIGLKVPPPFCVDRHNHFADDFRNTRICRFCSQKVVNVVSSVGPTTNRK